jgi:hypothetical protein
MRNTRLQWHRRANQHQQKKEPWVLSPDHTVKRHVLHEWLFRSLNVNFSEKTETLVAYYQHALAKSIDNWQLFWYLWFEWLIESNEQSEKRLDYRKADFS